MKNALAAPTTFGQALSLALQRHQAGDVATAAEVYREVLRHDPGNAQITYLLALCDHQSGRYDDAERLFRAAIDLDAGQAQFHIGMGRNHKQQGRYAEAIACYRLALELVPNSVDALVSLGVALRRSGKLEESISVLERTLALRPDSGEAAVNLGNALFQAGQFDIAVERFREAAKALPNLPEVQNNLGRALSALGQIDEAEGHLRRAIELRPSYVEPMVDLAKVLRLRGSLHDAAALCARAATYDPSANLQLGMVLYDLGEWQKALESFEKFINSMPGNSSGHDWRGFLLQEQGQFDLAMRAFDESIAMAPESPEGYLLKASTYWLLGDFSNTLKSVDLALERDPANPRGLTLRGNVSLMAADIDDALAWYGKALTARPNHVEAQSNSMFVCSYHDGMDASRVFEVHREWGARVPARTPRVRPPRAQKGSSSRLRVGFVSPDFIQHSVAYFLEPVFAHHDRSRFEFVCYYNRHGADAVTQRFGEYAKEWRGIAGLTDDAVAELVRRDRIDILVDLAGHTADNRLGVFALAPAPVQATYLGYPTTTGLPAIDYRISDEIVDPEGGEMRNTEKLLRLSPSYFCYRPPVDAPSIGPLPMVDTNAPVFGSFNALNKLSSTTVQIWARVLKAVPDSRLLLKNKSLSDSGFRQATAARFAAEGIDARQLEFVAWEKHTDNHLAIYNRVDIALDTFPYNGATTTCEALWMGVPVVSLQGNTHASRMGASILRAAGFGDLVTASAEAFVDRCRALAGNANELARYRLQARERMRASALLDEVRFTRNFERALARMWDESAVHQRPA